MSTQAISATGTAPPDEAAAAARVAELQQMIAQVASGFTSSATATPTTSASTSASADFSSMLASAASAVPATSSDATTTGAGAGAYASTIDEAATEYGISPAILTGLINQESGFNPNAVSSAGAEGLTQVMPENFAADGITDPFNATQSIFGGAKQLGEDLDEFGGNVVDALAAYNAGSAAVKQYGGVPPYTQTQNYVSDILGYAQQYEEQQPTSAASASALDPSTAVSA
jgi:soluble lytic murein transglycosylase-like protein